MTRLVDLLEIQSINGNDDVKILFTKEYYAEHDKIVGQHGIEEKEFKILTSYQDSQFIKKGLQMYLLTEAVTPMY